MQELRVNSQQSTVKRGVGWVEERRRKAASRRVTQHPKTLVVRASRSLVFKSEQDFGVSAQSNAARTTKYG
ncbi:hypothetical protein NIES22_64970 [Calothrix brevissima NIES-22]|nr:hypothetical protein NIES22_64970 [Calothrix brevissima NIES-22]